MTRRKKTVSAAALLAAAIGAGSASAQIGTWNLDRPPEDNDGPVWALNYDAGYASPDGPDGPSKKGSAAFQLSLEHQENSVLWDGLEIGHQFGHPLSGRTSGRHAGDMDGDGQKDYLNFTSDVKVKVFHITPYLRVGKVFGQRGRFRLRHTASFGAGLYYTTWNQGTFALTGITSKGTKLNGAPVVYGAYSSANFGVNFGSALDFWVREGFSFGIELRYHNLFDPTFRVGYVLPAGRLTFFF